MFETHVDFRDCSDSLRQRSYDIIMCTCIWHMSFLHTPIPNKGIPKISYRIACCVWRYCGASLQVLSWHGTNTETPSRGVCHDTHTHTETNLQELR